MPPPGRRLRRARPKGSSGIGVQPDRFHPTTSGIAAGNAATWLIAAPAAVISQIRGNRCRYSQDPEVWRTKHMLSADAMLDAQLAETPARSAKEVANPWRVTWPREDLSVSASATLCGRLKPSRRPGCKSHMSTLRRTAPSRLSRAPQRLYHWPIHGMVLRHDPR